ncbi:MAG: SH3 domain-containing protein [Acutalibacteraceae bacterium]|nr:SH3 domain-containing protein [Acutalibacteraceae bacterium]
MKRKILSILLLIVMIFGVIPVMPTTAAGKKYVKRTTSELGVNFIEVFEGYYQYAYWDYSQYTIGYGSRCEKDEYPAGISEPAAHALLKKILPSYESGLNSFLSKNDIYVTQNQYDALISFTYNFGAYVWDRNPTIAKYLKNGIDKYTDKQIAKAFGLWVNAGGQKLQGLVERRAAEAKLFCTDDFSFDKEVYVVSTSLNIRKGPGTSYSYVASLNKGDAITVTEKRYVGEKIWGKITYNKTNGWVMLNYAKYANDQSTDNSLISTCLYNVENTANGISLQWKKVNGADGYKIFRKEEGKSAYLLTHTVTSKNTVSYVDKNVTQKQYYYYITAYKGNVSATKSAVCRIEFVKSTTLKSLSKLSNGFKISWTKLSGATGYQVLRRNDGDDSFVKIATVDSSKSEYSDTKAVGGIKYFYTVKAVSSAGVSGAPNALSGIYIGGVKVTSASNTKTSVTINWSSSYNVDGYYVYRKKQSEKNAKKTATVKGASNTSYTDKTVAKSTSYTYYVKAYKGSSVSSSSPAFTTKIYTPPTVNSIKTSTLGLTVSWKAVLGIKKYNLYRKAYGESSYKKIATVNGTSYTDKTAVSGKKYYYRPSSVSDAGTESYKGGSKSSWFFSTTNISSATATKNGLKIAWKSVSGAVSYSVYKYERKKYTLLGTVKSSSFTDKTAKAGTSRIYAIKVNYANGSSNYSAKFTAYHLNTPKLKVKNVSNGLLLSWNSVKNAKGIIIYRKGPDDKSFKRYTKIDKYEKLTFENSTVVSGKKYSYKIKVTNGGSVSSVSNTVTKTRK